LIALEKLMGTRFAMAAQNIKKKSRRWALSGKKSTRKFGSQFPKGVKKLTPLFISSE
jgi:hypothetical protein